MAFCSMKMTFQSTFESPVRKTLWPVMNDDRPAVQLCSP